MIVYLVEFSSSPQLSSDVLNRFASGNGYVSFPTDTPPNVVYAARLVNPGTFERHLWQPGTVTGTGTVSAGVVEIANADGALDYLADNDVDRRPITILRGDDGAARAAFTTVFVGTIQSIAFTTQIIQIHIFDRMAEVAGVLISPTQFAGAPVPAFVNPGFLPAAPLAAPYYGAIANWSGGSGSAPADPGYFWDNGRAIGAPPSVLFLQGAAISQSVSGFVVGRKYQITVQANARSFTGGATLGVRVAGTVVYSGTVAPVNAFGGFSAAFASITTGPFTATASTMVVQFEDDTTGDTSILLYNPFFTDFTVDASATNLDGAYKPLLLGEAENFSPPLVNAAKLIYQISTQPIAALVSVSEGGAPITFHAQRASLNQLQTNAPPLGAYDMYLGTAGTDGAYFRLGSTPGQNAITAYAQEGATAADRTVGQVAKRALVLAGVDPATLAGVTALDAVSTAVVGFWCDTAGVTLGAVMDALCLSVAGTWVPDRLGNFQIKYLRDPTGRTPALTITPPQMLTGTADPITVLPINDGVPPYQIEVSYARNWTVQATSALQGSVTDARRAALALQYQKVIRSNPAVWDPIGKTGRNPLSVPYKISTCLRAYPDAFILAFGQQGLHAPNALKRLYVQISVAADQVPSLDIGAVVNIVAPRYSFLGGRLMILVGMLEDYANNRITLFCWG